MDQGWKVLRITCSCSWIVPFCYLIVNAVRTVKDQNCVAILNRFNKLGTLIGIKQCIYIRVGNPTNFWTGFGFRPKIKRILRGFRILIFLTDSGFQQYFKRLLKKQIKGLNYTRYLEGSKAAFFIFSDLSTWCCRWGEMVGGGGGSGDLCLQRGGVERKNSRRQLQPNN